MNTTGDIFEQVGRKTTHGVDVVVIRWLGSGRVQLVPAADFRQFECDHTQFFPADPRAALVDQLDDGTPGTREYLASLPLARLQDVAALAQGLGL